MYVQHGPKPYLKLCLKNLFYLSITVFNRVNTYLLATVAGSRVKLECLLKKSFSCHEEDTVDTVDTHVIVISPQVLDLQLLYSTGVVHYTVVQMFDLFLSSLPARGAT